MLPAILVLVQCPQAVIVLQIPALPAMILAARLPISPALPAAAIVQALVRAVTLAHLLPFTHAALAPLLILAVFVLQIPAPPAVILGAMSTISPPLAAVVIAPVLVLLDITARYSTLAVSGHLVMSTALVILMVVGPPVILVTMSAISLLLAAAAIVPELVQADTPVHHRLSTLAALETSLMSAVLALLIPAVQAVMLGAMSAISLVLPAAVIAPVLAT